MVHVHGRRRVGATMPPEGKDNLKGQACLGCKRNGKLTMPRFEGTVNRGNNAR